MQIKLTLILYTFCILINSQTVAQEFIYRITVDQKKIITGFKVAGQEGIVTTLHGVAGSKRITVTQMSNSVVYDDDVKITFLDLAKDVCIVNSKSINSIPQQAGLKISAVKSISKLNGASVIVRGFPWSIPRYQTINASLDGDHAMESLNNLLPAGSSRQALVNRKSPDIQQNVINLHGNIYPGHSGSPILYNNELIGVVDGGLLLGPGYAWGIIYNQIKLVTFNSSDPDYKNILGTNDALFSNEPAYAISNLKDSLQNPAEQPATILSIKREEDGSLDFLVLNNSPVDLGGIHINVRFYNKDLTEILDSRMEYITDLPINQKVHGRVRRPIHIKDYDCIQYDFIVNGYPNLPHDYKKTYLACDLK